MKGCAVRLSCKYMVHGCVEDCVFAECSVCYFFCYARKLLVYDAAGSDIHMADL